MKNRLILLHVLFLLVLVSITITSHTGGHPWVISALVGVAMVVLFLVIRSWMAFVNQLLIKSDLVLNKSGESRAVWSFSNIETLINNQQQVEKKFKVSAELIADLAHPEKAGSMDDLISNDPIGKALQNIRTEMQRLKDEDDKQAWISQGLAKFSTILRNKAEVKEYTQQIISNLVKYLGANQGSLFIEYGEAKERYLELTACYAYDKRKYLENKIFPGQGLVGQCMLERDYIFLTDVPKDYVRITSGLGEATPRNIVVAPLIFNEVFCGAIELALFQVMKPHHLEFLKKVCENIASEIASLKNIAHTQQLLEASNTLTQELQSREEEMKQNLEELAATQEEMARKQAELSGIINAIDSTLATAEFDMRGKLIKHNSILEQFFGFNTERMNEFNQRNLLGAETELDWMEIIRGEIRSGDFKTTTASGADLWLSVTFTPIADASGKPARILCMIQNITQKKLKEKEFERLSLVANNTDNSVIITDKNGVTEYVNEGFTKITGYEPHHIIGKKPGDLLQGPMTDKNTIEKLRQKINEGVPIYEEILNYNRNGETYWVSLAINPVRDEHGHIIRFISIQADITQTKIEALDFHQKMEALSRSNAIIEIDLTGKVIAINENYLELLGYERDEVIGQSYSFLTHKEHIFDKMLHTIQEHGMQSGTFSRYDKQGRRHCLKLMDYPVLNIHGDVEKIIEFGVDVTNERRLARESDRRQAELKSYLAGINNTIASAEFDLQGNFRSGNDIFLKVMGYDAVDILDKHFAYFMGEDPSVVMMWENLKLGKFFSGEFKMRDKTGKELWLNGTFNPIIVEGDVPEKIMMFAQFTTQEKEKVNDLTGVVNALKSTLPVMEFNENFACKTANEKAMKIFGVSRLELRNKTILDFIAPYYHAAWKKKQSEILEKEFSDFLLPVTITSQVVTYEVSLSVIRNLEGKVTKVVALFVKEAQEHVPVLAAM